VGHGYLQGYGSVGLGLVVLLPPQISSPLGQALDILQAVGNLPYTEKGNVP